MAQARHTTDTPPHSVTVRGGDAATVLHKLMTVREVADVLGVPTSRVYDCWRDWELPMFRVGQQLRCDPGELAEWINNHRAV
jgi:excisionase family DNA binding protein